LNDNKHFGITASGFPKRKGIRIPFLLVVFTLIYFSAHAQAPAASWVRDLGGISGSCTVTGLAVDKQNNIYITGYFAGTVDFDPSTAVKNLTSGGVGNVFIGKYTSTGTLIWAEAMSGNGYDMPEGVAVDSNGNVSITGQFGSATLDADPGPGVYNLTNPDYDNGEDALFIIHLDTNGGFLWASSLARSIGNAVSADSQSNVIMAATFVSPITIGDSTYTPTPGNNDGLLVKYNTNGTVLWVIVLANAQILSNDGTYDICVDGQDNIVLSGHFFNTLNFNPLGAAYTVNATTSGGLFVAKYSSTGILTWVNEVSATGFAVGYKVGVDRQNSVYYSSSFEQSITFDSTVLNSTDSQSLCIAKYSSTGVLQFAKSTTGMASSSCEIFAIATDDNNNLYLTGNLFLTVNFNLNAGNAENLTSHGLSGADFFVAEYDQNGNYHYAFNGGTANCRSTAGRGLAIDFDSKVDVAGAFCATVNFDASGCTLDSLTAIGNPTDGFLAQYSPLLISNNIITAPTISTFCGGGIPATITGSLPSGGSDSYSYQWQSSVDSVNFFNINDATAQNYTPTQLTATTYFQRIVSSGTCTPPVISNIVALTITSPPTAPTVAAVVTCVGSTATLSVTSPQVGYTYNWYTTATGDTAVFTGVSFTTPSLSDSVTFYVVAAYSTGCVSTTRTTATVTIVQPLATPVVTVGPTTGSTIVFEWAAVTGATGYQVSTDNGQSYSAVAGLTDTVSGLQAGQSVTILVQAIGVVPCQLSAASVAVTGLAISPTDDLIYVPNVFTPNGDGTNDIVHVHSENIRSLKFYIFDQWGELLFISTSIQNGWDGTYKGTKEPVGVYVYLVEAVMNDGRSVTKKGTVTLIR
jgi:gliding motility-associated-like protein